MSAPAADARPETRPDPRAGPDPAPPGAPPPAAQRRAVILVGDPANPYPRAIRIGHTLSEQGFEVEIAATFERGTTLEEHHREILLRRYPPSGWFASVAATYGQRPAGPKPRWPILARAVRAAKVRVVSWLYWPHIVRGWWHTLARELAPADLYHACGTLPLAAALAARERDRRAGRDSKVILDVVDITMEATNELRIPALIRRMLGRRERGWARRADAHTALNQQLARRATGRWRLARSPTVIPNYPEPWAPPPGAPPADRIRAVTGLPATTRICLFWGRLGPYVGLDQAAEAILQVPDTALVILGFGPGWDRSVARDADPKYASRHFTLPAVHPDELPAWVASADVALCTLPPLSYTQRFATPNKLLEAMAGGTPIVLGPRLPTMESLLRDENLGRVAASMEPADIATAVREILDLPASERAAWRGRIAAIARERYSWPLAAAAYLDVLASLGLTGHRSATS